MAINKVELSDGTVLLDLTADTVTAADVADGKTFHLANGESATGTMTAESEVIFCSETALDDLTQYRGKTLALNPGSSSDVAITVAGADSAYDAGFEIAVLPYDMQSATIKFTSGTICAAGLEDVLDASSSAVEITLEKYAAIGLKKCNSGLWFITGQWEVYEDTTKGEKVMIYIMSGGGTGCTLVVTGVAGDNVTVSKDGKTYSKTFKDDGTATFKGLKTGTWTVTMTDGTSTASRTVTIDSDYTLTITYFSATINLTYPEGSTCTATDGTTTLSAPDTSGTWACVVPNAGDWTVTATDGTDTATETVTITAEGQVETVELSYILVLVDNGMVVVKPVQKAGGSGTYTYDMTSGAKVLASSGSTSSYAMYWTVDVTYYTTLTFTVKYYIGAYTYGQWEMSTILNTDYTFQNFIGNKKTDAQTVSGTDDISFDLTNYSGAMYILFGFSSGAGGASSCLNITDLRLEQ